MEKRYAIFDLDGTLADSMPYWVGLTGEFLRSKGVTDPPADILERIKPMTVSESAALFIELFSLEGTPESVAAEIDGLMCRHYIEDIPLKAGAAEYLGALQARGVRMCVASATAEPLIDACLKRLGVRDLFDFLLSCESVGAGKNRPDVYLAAAKRLGAAPGEIAVYEDAGYAVKTAKEAGFFVYGVYDLVSGRNWDKIEKLADALIFGWDEAKEHISDI